MRKYGGILAYLLLFACLLLSGCTTADTGRFNQQEQGTADDSRKIASSGEVKLSVYMYVTDVRVQNVYYDIARSFEAKHPEIKVELQFPGFQYEEILKVKLATNELPDIFDTHGWAKIRYGKYLVDLSNEPWASQLTNTIKPVVTDDEGKVYVLPISEARDGFSYNINVLEKYHIQVPVTFDELMAAAEKIVKESHGEVVPFFFSGIDSWTIGQYFDYYASSLFEKSDVFKKYPLTASDSEWSQWNVLAVKWKEMFDKGYINQDVFKAKYSDLPKLFAEGKVAFSFASPSFADDAYEVNPKTRIGIMPVPSLSVGGRTAFSSGERNTMGIWKKSKHLNEAKLLVNEFAKPANMKKIADVVKIPPGLTGVTPEHEFVSFYNLYDQVLVTPYFDRIYLPNGMWDVMRSLGIELIAGDVAPEKFGKLMKQEVARLSK
ncbi:ABC transporter substrate-binding protein [Paenibacillus qinlingensis]|uniref:ABC transporter substrate-binding protein n=1 Tax=Paenibacillus qinlingensis TaxID=1837343 RepID=UPI00156571BE|nr:ABC transporter substrate-binding protein [Paenibacillus qinlingensis]NQX58606.1 carbohydrate ABC transporter substrate-binding protein [Paenibacillus qinlingensis]